MLVIPEKKIKYTSYIHIILKKQDIEKIKPWEFALHYPQNSVQQNNTTYYLYPILEKTPQNIA